MIPGHFPPLIVSIVKGLATGKKLTKEDEIFFQRKS
jgi:hypothetical protein